MNNNCGNENSENPIKVKNLENIDLEMSNINLNEMKRKHTSQEDLEKAQIEGQKLLAEGDIDQLMKEKSKFEKQSISLFRIYCLLCEGIYYFFLILAIIGSIGGGISMPLMGYITPDVFSDVGNTSENRDTEMNIETMKTVVKKNYECSN